MNSNNIVSDLQVGREGRINSSIHAGMEGECRVHFHKKPPYARDKTKKKGSRG